jgi:hypothetical protein
MRSRWSRLGVAAAAVVLAGAAYYVVLRPATPPQAQRLRDPAMGLLLSIRALESDPATQLSREQIAQILPFLKALKDIPASDTQAVEAIVQAVRDTFTPSQRAALDAARQRFQERQRAGGVQAGGGGGPEAGGGPPGGRFGAGGPGGPGAQGGGEEQRQQFRSLAFDRMIRYLERRMR